MKTSHVVSLLSLGLAHSAQASAIPAASVPVVSTDLMPYNWTTVELAPTSGVAEVPTRLAKRASERIVMATIASNTAIVGAACSYGGPWVCGATAITVVLGNFFTQFYARSGPTPNSLVPAGWKRDSSDFVVSTVHENWLPTGSCSTVACQLQTFAPHGAWTHFGNATLNSVHHDLHFHQNGDVKGLRAVQRSSSSNGKRDDYSDKGGIVATYFWKNNHRQAYVADSLS